MLRASRPTVAVTLVLGATWFALARTGSAPFDVFRSAPPADPSAPVPAAFDVYAHILPIMAYAGEALRAGGGLLWTPLQNCGQPFAAMNGLLYPPHWLPVVFGFDAGLRLLVAVHLLLGGVFAYLLGRELGARPAAALLGALAFQLGNSAAHVATWTPLVLEPFMWFPAAFLFVERLLRAPSVRGALGLGAACWAALLPAWPQLVLFLYQLVGLRVLWALAIDRPPRLAAAVGGITAGLLLGPMLDAVQLLPALEVARESVRRVTLSEAEIVLVQPFAFADFRRSLAGGMVYGQPIALVPAMLASLAFLAPGRRRTALFYGLAGTLFFVLGLGPETPLFDLYLMLPGGRLFREPARFVWVSGFCLAVLTALGSEALAAVGERAPARRIWIVPALAAAVVVALEATALGGLRRVELAIGLAAVGVLAVARPGRRGILPALGVLFAITLVLQPVQTLNHLYPSSAPLETHAALFDRLRPRTAPLWRTYIAADDPLGARFALMPKSASLFGVPTVTDYEPQTARRFAEFLVMLRTGGPMRSLNAFYYPVQGWMGPGLNRNLLDLTAARLLVADGDADPTRVLAPPPPLIDRSGDVRVYENPSALPRALWIPRVEVVPSSAELLRRLALRWVDPWQVALVEAPPPSGFLGDETPAPPATPAQVAFARDDPEALALDVQAPQRGFLLLADQHRPGWHATVDGRPAPILRANYAFRAVEVPAGTSRVEFAYRPRAVVVGAAVSVAALLGVLAALLLTRPSPPGRRAPAGSTR